MAWSNGFWNCLLLHDFDKDGDIDMVVGNYGLNNQIKPSEDRPASLYYYDFDQNSSVDPLLFYYIKDKSYPFPTKDELTEQLPSLKKKYPTYESYVSAQLNTMLPTDMIEKASLLNAYVLETTYFVNDHGVFRMRTMPIELQFSPVFALAVADVNKDGYDDLITGGNLERTRARTGLLKGNNGFVFLGDNKGSFKLGNPAHVGISISNDVRKIVVNGNTVFYITNNGAVRSFTLEK